ncbi:MAG: UbiA family prenyltransferase [Pirellulales bacterium]|nr:UbiA family prenyltransferase [Pirellulales bacterium]
MNIRAYIELIRLPNVFTAMADVGMGFFFIGAMGSPGDGLALGLLLTVSVCLYSFGIVLNDLADMEIDRQERPERPLPSGRVAVRGAWTLAGVLLVVAMAASGGASLLSMTPAPLVVAGALAAAIVSYDFWPGRGPLAVLMMGACRMGNVLLGMSAAGYPAQNACWIAAGGIGLYIVGVTTFARQETKQSRRGLLVLGIALMMGGVGLLAWLPAWRSLHIPADKWHLFMTVFGLLIAWQCRGALLEPSPERVQQAVKQCILSLVILDASVCLAAAGPVPALAIVLLLVPTVALGKSISST